MKECFSSPFFDNSQRFWLVTIHAPSFDFVLIADRVGKSAKISADDVNVGTLIALDDQAGTLTSIFCPPPVIHT